MRWADLVPMPGKRPSSSSKRCKSWLLAMASFLISFHEWHSVFTGSQTPFTNALATDINGYFAMRRVEGHLLQKISQVERLCQFALLDKSRNNR